MGLFDDERMNGIVAAVIQLNRLRGFEASEHRHLNQLLGKFWPSLMAGQGNSSFWLFGGSLSDSYLGQTNVAKAAFSQVLDSFRAPNDYTDGMTLEDMRKERPDSPEKDLDAYLDRYRPNVFSFLSKVRTYDGARGKCEHHDVMQVYGACESFMYFANRYSDEFSRSCEKLRDLVAEIKGAVLERFAIDPVYLASYMAGCIFDRILIDDVDDMVTTWFKTVCLHHHGSASSGRNSTLS